MHRVLPSSALSFVVVLLPGMCACTSESRPGHDPATGQADAAPGHADAARAPTARIAAPTRALKEATKADVERAIRVLEGAVKGGATDLTNAWALAHGLAAFGKDLKAADGRLAIDVIVTDFVETTDVDGRETYRFPEQSALGLPVDPHRNLMVKSMIEAGVPLSRKFRTKGGGIVTLERLVHDAERTATIPTAPAEWRNWAWTWSALVRVHKPTDSVRLASGSEKVSTLAIKTLAELEDEQSFLEAPMRSSRPDLVDKRKQGIYAHTCGGLHFVQAAVQGIAGTKDPGLVLRARHELDLVLFRWEAERAIYGKALSEHPEFGLPLRVQELKFYGHVLETFAFAREQGVLEENAELSRSVRSVAGDLVLTLEELLPAYQALPIVRTKSAQTYYDLIGDGCHAIRGLRRVLPAFFTDVRQQD